jgi:hypothetical protein
MALVGVHIAFGYCNIGTVGEQQPPSLLFGCTSSQTMASAGTSTVVAPGSGSLSFQAVISISASAPIFYALGPNPVADGSDSPNKRRYMDPATGREDIFVNAGDKLAWVFA